MSAIEEEMLGPQLVAVLEQVGFAELVGGREAFRKGMGELRLRLLPLVGELAVAAEQAVELSEAVLDTEQFPHLAEFHGVLADAFELPAPVELAAWLRKVAKMGRLPATDQLGHLLAKVATSSPNLARRELARLGLFELVCLQHRLRLRKDRLHLETIGGRRRDVEILAEVELDVATVLAASLLEVSDPVGLVLQMANEAMQRYVDVLRSELGALTRDVHDQLERRQTILEAAERVNPADAVILLNETANEFDEERKSARQLRRAHPGLLGRMSDDLIYKRVERLPRLVAAGTSPRAPSLADTLVEIMQEMQR